MASRVAVVRAKYLSGWIGPSDASRSTAEPVALFGTQSALASGPQEAGEGPSYARMHSWKELQQALNALESRLPEANEQSTDQVLTACGAVHAWSAPAQAASAGAFWPTRRAAVSPDNRGAGKWQLQSRELPPPVSNQNWDSAARQGCVQSACALRRAGQTPGAASTGSSTPSPARPSALPDSTVR